jgi:hypothetical protein
MKGPEIRPKERQKRAKMCSQQLGIVRRSMGVRQDQFGGPCFTVDETDGTNGIQKSARMRAVASVGLFGA